MSRVKHPSDDETPIDLARISTHWSELNEPSRFAMRYARAIRNYLHALIPNTADAEDISQEFLLVVTRKGFTHANPERGKFRYYLITAVRNAARAHFQRKQSRPDQSGCPLPEALSDGDNRDKWLEEWKACLLDRVWQSIERHEKNNPGNLACTILRLVTDNPDASSEDFSAQVEKLTGQPIRPDAFRKQRSRARRLFAEILAEEVAQTLEQPTAEDIKDELGELGFLELVRPYLPE